MANWLPMKKGIHKLHIAPLILLLSIISGYLTYAQEELGDKPPKFEFKGYIKDIQGFNFSGNFDSSTWINLIHNRINTKYNFGSKLTARLEMRNRIFLGTQVSETPGFAESIDQYPGYFDLSIIWVNNPSLVIQSVIDRLLLKYSVPKWDITVGRQRINWGMNNIWNPNDIFNAYNFLDFDYEERPGNDAIRVQHYPKLNSTLEFAWKPGREADENVASVLYRFNKKKYDYQALAGLYNTDLVVGGGWAGSIGNAGFKGEASYFHPYHNLADTTGVVSASVMSDFTFKNGWYISGSVLFNSNPSGYFGNGGIYNTNLSAKALFPFRYSFYTGVAKSFATVFTLNASVIYSPDNNSLILFPSFAYNASENIDVDLTIQSFFSSDKGTYKSMGTALFLRGKWSF
jgi:hypothetical protein